jgi:hypothetical protein
MPRRATEMGCCDARPPAGGFPGLLCGVGRTLRLRGGKLRDEGVKPPDSGVKGYKGDNKDNGVVISEVHGRGFADKHQRKRFRRKERAAQTADANRMRKLSRWHQVERVQDQQARAPGAGYALYAASASALKDEQAKQDNPIQWLQEQLDVAQQTGAEVPTIQDALRRHVPASDSAKHTDQEQDSASSSDLGTSSSSQGGWGGLQGGGGGGGGDAGGPGASEEELRFGEGLGGMGSGGQGGGEERVTEEEEREEREWEAKEEKAKILQSQCI